ncbi:MAG: class I SAM-dependent methyltransferase [Candidatus Omnitrophica bacterium]|jgi:predicted O-methyltransferase YrrM|nr:class I SAM-dependent methyltransferase [Candidatus Omnitrophota bacterium]
MDVRKAILEKFRFRGTRDNMPMSSPKGTRETLAELLEELDFNKGIEVGSRKGHYAMVLCQKNPKLELTCIDPWKAYSHLTQEKQDEIFEEWKKNMQPFNAKFIRKYSMDALIDFEDRSLDFAFIDGNHEFDYAAPDIIFWAKKVKVGGIFAVHDYYNFYRSGVIKAVDAYTHCNRIKEWYCTQEKTPIAFWINI